MFDRNKKEGAGSVEVDSSQSGLGNMAGNRNTASQPLTTRSGGSEVAVIGRSIRINGDLQGEEDLKIEGDVTGTVNLQNNTLTIGSAGNISANVYAKSVTIDGSMDGDVFGFERVSIRKNAQVRGNITAPRVSLEDGARFKGSIEMDPTAVEAAFGRTAGNSKGPASTNKSARIASVAGSDPSGTKSGMVSSKTGTKSESGA